MQCLLASLCLPVFANEILIPAAPQVGGRAYILMDYGSGEIISESQPDEHFPPASLTKIMTVYVVASEIARGNISMQDKVMISEKAWRMGGSKMFVEVGKKVSVENLLKGVIIQSGNDASVAIAEFISGTEAAFADLMNLHAKKLGLNNSHFVNATGLPHEGHYSSVGDLAALSRQLIREFPKIYAMHSIEEFSYGGITQKNRNKQLWMDEYVDGIKTGHTDEAGYCLATSAQRGDMRLISVVIGMKSEYARRQASSALLNYGFRFYETAELINANVLVETVPIWKGYSNTVQLGLAEKLVLTIPKGALDALEFKGMDQKTIIAPVERGQRLGTLHIKYAGKLLASRPLIALHGVSKGSLYRRTVDSMRLWWH
ncbi:MAG: D-alanyl-D-alanine carboxypeptidase family protein [Candidatus Eutrophobiaceae bacterium]